MGNFLVVVRALTYLLTLGRQGIPEAAQNAVLNANYLQARLRGTYTPAYDRICMHEFVLDLSGLKKETGVSALDVAKSLIDEGIHPPTMYFPLIVHEALMLEPTETEGPESWTRRRRCCGCCTSGPTMTPKPCTMHPTICPSAVPTR